MIRGLYETFVFVSDFERSRRSMWPVATLGILARKSLMLRTNVTPSDGPSVA